MDLMNPMIPQPSQPGNPELATLYPGAFGKSTARTGMPKFGPTARTGSGYALGTSGNNTPPPGAGPVPQPVNAAASMQSMVAPTAQPQAMSPQTQTGGFPTAGAPPASSQSFLTPVMHPGQPAPGGAAPQGGADPYGLTPDQEQQLNEWFKSLYSGPDYKGRNEANHALLAQYQQMLSQRNHEAPIDYSGGAQIGQYYDRARQRQAAMDAAMGRSGGGVGAAGQEALYGQQGSAVADMVRQLLEQRRQETNQQDNWMRNLSAATQMQGLQRNWQKQDSPSFWQDLLKTAGGIGGDLLGGLLP